MGKDDGRWIEASDGIPGIQSSLSMGRADNRCIKELVAGWEEYQAASAALGERVSAWDRTLSVDQWQQPLEMFKNIHAVYRR